MAFDAFKLARAMNESAGNFIGAVDAHRFASDDLNACTAEMNYGIVCEAADFQHTLVGGDDILAETAVENPGNLESLSESVFDNLKAKVVSFFKKVVAMVKGIIEKIKAAIYKMTGKTTKWCDLMEPKLRKVTGASDFKVEMYPYDRAYITKGLSDKLKSLLSAWNNEVGISANTLNDFKRLKDTYAAAAGGHAGEAEGSNGGDGKDGVVKDNEEAAEKEKELTEKFKDDWADKLCKMLADTSATSIDGVWTEVIKKARGDESSKTPQAVFSDWSSMFNTIKDSSKTLDNIKKVYDEHLKVLQKVQSDIEKSGSDLKITNETKDPKVPADVANSYRSLISARYNHIITVTQAYETAASTARQTNINLMNQMVGDYMGALNKLAGFKEKKKD